MPRQQDPALAREANILMIAAIVTIVLQILWFTRPMPVTGVTTPQQETRP